MHFLLSFVVFSLRLGCYLGCVSCFLLLFLLRRLGLCPLFSFLSSGARKQNTALSPLRFDSAVSRIPILCPFFLSVQKEHPQNPMVRECCDTEEEKLGRALGMSAAVSRKGEALRGYDGFLSLMYAFTEQSACEVRGTKCFRAWLS